MLPNIIPIILLILVLSAFMIIFITFLDAVYNYTAKWRIKIRTNTKYKSKELLDKKHGCAKFPYE